MYIIFTLLLTMAMVISCPEENNTGLLRGARLLDEDRVISAIEETNAHPNAPDVVHRPDGSGTKDESKAHLYITVGLGVMALVSGVGSVWWVASVAVAYFAW